MAATVLCDLRLGGDGQVERHVHVVLVVDRHGPPNGVVPAHWRVPRAWAAGPVLVEIAIRHENVLDRGDATRIARRAGEAPLLLFDPLDGGRWGASTRAITVGAVAGPSMDEGEGRE